MTTFCGVCIPLRRPRLRGILSYSNKKIVTKNLSLCGSQQSKFRDSSLLRFDTIQQCEVQTDGLAADRRTFFTIAKTRLALIAAVASKKLNSGGGAVMLRFTR